MAHLAFYTFGILRGPAGSEQTLAFFETAPGLFQAAAQNPGLIAQVVEGGQGWPLAAQDWGRWGRFVAPRFYDGALGTPGDTVATTLSVWSSIEAVRGFAYQGAHLHALRRRADWFVKGEWPSYAMWWIAEGETPTWEQAASRLEQLHDRGPSPAAFNFGCQFEPGV
jgi:hypothetical protein